MKKKSKVAKSKIKKDFTTPVFAPNSTQAKAVAAAPTQEVGVVGLNIPFGYLREEYLPELQGMRGREKYRQMADSDATIGGVLWAFDRFLSGVKWRVEANPEDKAGLGKKWMEECIDDMEHPWEDHVSEVITMLPFGFSMFEVVLKQRLGERRYDPLHPENYSTSIYNDGTFGIKKLAPRAQETIDRWEMDRNGKVLGAWQRDFNRGGNFYLPMERCLLYRTVSRKDNPEGRSILRNAYTSYLKLSNIETYEAIGIERELTGVPSLFIPAAVLNDDQKRPAFEEIVRDLRNNEQGGVILPSDTIPDAQGNPTDVPAYRLQLIASAGTRSLDTSQIISRHQASIARSMLADFIMVGTGGEAKGSYALSSDKSEMFLESLNSILRSIAAVENRNLIPKLWAWNAFPRETMPKMVPEDVKPEDIQALADFLVKTSTAGFPFAGDANIEDFVRSAAGLPERKEEDQLLPPLEDLPPVPEVEGGEGE